MPAVQDLIFVSPLLKEFLFFFCFVVFFFLSKCYTNTANHCMNSFKLLFSITGNTSAV